IIPSCPTNPVDFKIRVTINKVAIDIPLTGLFEDPIIPTILEETVAKKNPNTTIMIAPMIFTGVAGIKNIRATAITTIRIEAFAGISVSSLSVGPELEVLAFICFIESLNDETIIGKDLMRDI